MKILLTGGSGFIGRNVKESYLNEKYQIIAPSRNELDCADDKSVELFFSKTSFDVVIHSAVKPSHRNANDLSGIVSTNSRMALNLLKYSDSWGRFLNMGSGAIYDMKNYKPKMKEEYYGTHIPSDDHGYTKYILGLVFPQYKNVVDFRIFGIFGKYEDYAIRFISNAICKSLFDFNISIRQNRNFDYLFIDDLMPVLDHFIIHDAAHVAYNITPDHSIGLVDAAKIVKEISGKKIEILVEKDGMGLEYSGDNSKLKTEIKNINFTSPEKSIEILYQWYAVNKNILQREKLLFDK
ncbi:MAG: NAD(P)-dependent oxidoreductase [Bacteroidota bacterium]